jgi:hypothetical protein
MNMSVIDFARSDSGQVLPPGHLAAASASEGKAAEVTSKRTLAV